MVVPRRRWWPVIYLGVQGVQGVLGGRGRRGRMGGGEGRVLGSALSSRHHGSMDGLAAWGIGSGTDTCC